MHYGGADTHVLAAEGGLGGQGHALAAHGESLNDQLAPLDVGIVLGGSHIVHGHALQPSGLPNTRGAGVGATVGVVQGGLLTAGLGAAAELIPYAYGESVLTLLQGLGDVEGEGHVAADMVAHVLTVDPHLGVVVASADVEQNPLTCPVSREGQSFAVPYAVTEILVTDARQLALAAEGNRDGLGEGSAILETALFAGQSAIGLILPRTVEVEPVGIAAVKLGAGKFGTGRVGCVEHSAYLAFAKILTLLYRLRRFLSRGNGKEFPYLFGIFVKNYEKVLKYTRKCGIIKW